MPQIKLILGCFIFAFILPLSAEEPVAEGSLVQDSAVTEEPIAEGSLTKSSSRTVANPQIRRIGKYLIGTTKAQYGVPVEGSDGEITSRIANEFVDKLTASEFSEASKYFDSTMRNKMPTRFLRKNWLTLLRGSGEFQSKGKDWISATDVYQVSHVPVLLADKQLVLRVVVSDEKINNLYIGLPWKDELSSEAEGDEED